MTLRACFAAICFFAFGVSASAAPMSQIHPYYGAQFSTGGQHADIKAELQNILQSDHQIVKNGPDRIVSNCSGNDCYRHTPLTYSEARTFLLGKFYLVKHNNGYAIRDVYCQREYGSNEFKGRPPGPGVLPNDAIVNVEHTWPQSRFGGRYPRDMQKTDLHHLFPTDSQLNSRRGNVEFGEVVHQEGPSLKCPISRYGETRDGRTVFEPPAVHRGNVARALFYFSVKYELPIRPGEEETLRAWDREDPIDEEEIQRNDEIYEVQGSRNPFVDFDHLADQIKDF